MVTFLENQANVAVWSDTVLPGHTDDGLARYYECTDSAQLVKIVYIYADIDVSVNVFFKRKTSEFSDPKSFVVNPVDTFGTVFQTVYKEKAYCYPISVHTNVTCSISHSKPAPVIVSNEHLYSGHSFLLKDDTFIKTTKTITPGCTYHFDKPSTMFCMYEFQSVIQTLPLSSWSTKYFVPGNLTEDSDFTFELQLFASVDETDVSVNTEASTVRLHKKGDFHQMKVNTSVGYTIMSSSPIAVGLVVKQKDNLYKVRSLHMIPPVSSYTQNGLFISVPISRIRDMFNTSILQTFTVYENGQSMMFSETLPFNKDVYQIGKEGAAGYGFSISQNSKGDILVVPGYTQTTSMIQVRDRLSCLFLFSKRTNHDRELN